MVCEDVEFRAGFLSSSENSTNKGTNHKSQKEAEEANDQATTDSTLIGDAFLRDGKHDGIGRLLRVLSI